MANEMRFKVTDEDGSEICEATLDELLEDNLGIIEPEDLDTLAIGETWQCGGGAAPLVTYTRIE